MFLSEKKHVVGAKKSSQGAKKSQPMLWWSQKFRPPENFTWGQLATDIEAKVDLFHVNIDAEVDPTVTRALTRPSRHSLQPPVFELATFAWPCAFLKKNNKAKPRRCQS